MKKTCRGKGKDNIRWNNGASEYPNHTKFKKMRIKVLKRAKGRCEICGERAKIIHHSDGDKSNHSLDNLLATCIPCHEALECDENGKSVRGRPNKYNLIYGMKLGEIAKLFGVCNATIHNWLKNPDKKAWLEKKLKEN